MFKLKNALYGPKQTWYERLTMFLLEKGYKRERAVKTLFIR